MSYFLFQGAYIFIISLTTKQTAKFPIYGIHIHGAANYSKQFTFVGLSMLYFCKNYLICELQIMHSQTTAFPQWSPNMASAPTSH